ncbi:cytochrome P450 [Lentzea sp. NPDC004782]|uniref:cytochrome P450 n=1 Tax=Lentzea sp. NPDC004782 TaxID=3154458 RepID=UPI0033AC29AE
MLERLTGHEDPYPVYEAIRARGPISEDGGLYVTTSHAVCNKILRDRRFGVRFLNSSLPAMTSLGLRPTSFLEADPPDHTRLRRLAAPAFGPKMIDSYRPRVEKIAESLLDNDSMDLIQDFATPLPVMVISDLLGIEESDTRSFAEFGMRAASGSPLGGTYERITALFERLIHERRRRPGDDVISSLVAAEGEQKLTPDELLGMLLLLLLAGFETTVNLIGNGAMAFLDHPEQWELLKSDPGLAPAAVEEVLRWAPPVHYTGRVAHEAVPDLHRRMRRDDGIFLILAAANRDPEVYPEPNRFVITRARQPEHLAFGSGIHYCLGASLARMEGDVVFRALARRWPRINQTAAATFRESTTIRGFATFPVSRS